METGELARELIEFLNSTGQYRDFLEWEEQRGYDIDDVEEKMSEVEESF